MLPTAVPVDVPPTGGAGVTGYVLGPDEGEALWWAGSLNLTKLSSSAAGGGLDLVEHRVPAGYAPPRHVHADSDEVFYVLAGDFTVRCGAGTWSAGPGSVVFLPRGVPHAFTVSPDGPGRTLIMTAPAGFVEVIASLGVPAPELVLPGPDLPAPDPERLAAVARAHGIAPAPDAPVGGRG